MNRNLMLILLLLTGAVYSQEGLRPLTQRMLIENNVHRQSFKARATGIQIPFIDDFSYAGSAVYPSTSFWTDSTVFINPGGGINPPSIGVATFDGLNKNGYPYQPNLVNMAKSEPADSLTSQAINLFNAGSYTLQPQDSIGLSFFYQARGHSDAPESTDSLIVDFFKPRQNIWVPRVWFSRGNNNSNTVDTVFKKAFVRITDTAYLQDGFRIRFRNKATVAGSFDHWHIDYVMIDRNMQRNTTIYNDIALAYIPSSLLKDYTAMPYRQYRTSEMSQRLKVKIRNNSNQVLNMSYQHEVFNEQLGQNVHTYNGGPVNLRAYQDSGYSRRAAHASPDILSQYQIAPVTGNTDFRIKHYIFRSGTGLNDDIIKANDTVLQYLRLRNYYAFDDGSAEDGYYVNGIGGAMAVKVKVHEADEFTALRVYFDPDGNVSARYKFDIKVWADGGGLPGAQLFTQDTMTVRYITTGSRELAEYRIKQPFTLEPGIYYIGIQQRVATGIAVGFDVNNDFRQNMYYNSGSGWNQSGFAGALMIRPVIGAYEPAVGLPEKRLPSQTFAVFPNPARGQFFISTSTDRPFDYLIRDLTGRVILQGTSTSALAQFSSADLSAGVYLILISQDGRAALQQKLIIVR